MDKKQRRKWICKREDKSNTKQNRKKINSLRQAFCGNKIDKEPLKMQENNHFGLLCTKQKHRNTEKPKKQNHQNQKKDQKKHLLPFWQTTPIFVFFFFSLSCLQSCVCWKHYKNCVFSRTQLLGITDSKPPFGAPSQNGTFATKSAILGFPLCLLKPLFL